MTADRKSFWFLIFHGKVWYFVLEKLCSDKGAARKEGTARHGEEKNPV